MRSPFALNVHNCLTTLSAALAVTAGVAGARWYHMETPSTRAQGPMLLAPMIGVIEPCVLHQDSDPAVPESLRASCERSGGSAGALVESTLQELESHQPGPQAYPVGYTLAIPLLQLFQPQGDGWQIDEAMVRRLVHTVRDVQRPMIMYLFSTHFAANAPIERALAADPANMSHTRDGALGVDAYYDSSVYNWSFASTANALSERRAEAIDAVLQEACKLQAHDRAKIRGITLLGELHHLFPDFQAGMGFDGKYRITDYSAASVTGFRAAVEKEFGTVARLNRLAGSDYASFDEVVPPSKDIRTEPLRRFSEHIDPFAHGSLPVSGWAYLPEMQGGHPPQVHVYRNGQFAGKTPVQLSRQDVLAAKPEFGHANTGWRMDLDFRQWAAGQHRLDIFLETQPGRLVPLGTRTVAVMDRAQSTPRPLPMRALPATAPLNADIPAHIDFPHDQSSYYYNPLARVWHAFRARQVTQYLQHFNAQVAASCLSSVPRYTHQIMPLTNPSWDANKFAIEDSLQPQQGMRLGVSLYGEASYGSTFTHWLARSGHRRYGVTEFHPLKPMDAAAMTRTLDLHAQHGADFLSFFLEPQWEGQRVPRGHNIFSFDPLNTQFSSDVLYQAVQQAISPARK